MLEAKKDSNSVFDDSKFKVLFQDASNKNLQVVIYPASMSAFVDSNTHIFKSTLLLLFDATILIQATIIPYLKLLL